MKHEAKKPPYFPGSNQGMHWEKEGKHMEEKKMGGSHKGTAGGSSDSNPHDSSRMDKGSTYPIGSANPARSTPQGLDNRGESSAYGGKQGSGKADGFDSGED